MSPEAPQKRQHPLLIDEAGHTELLLGNEAIVRGAIEAGVGFACGYPGTPSTEVTEGFAHLAPQLGIPFEYSINEKVALEMAFASSLAGARAIVAMKHLGLMYAGDPLSTIPYVGTVGGLVIVSAGDPSCLTSPNEQDQRYLADSLHIPMLEPRTPQDALEATRFAFELSEESQLPVILRPTTRVCHTAAPVRFGPIHARTVRGFQRDPQRFLPLPVNARRMRLEIKERLKVARALVSTSGRFEARGRGRTAVLASGAPAATCANLLRQAGRDEDTVLLSLGVVYPLPEEWLLAQLRELETVLVVEELSPYLEDHLRAMCSLHELPIRVLGKRTGHFPEEFEYEPAVIAKGLNAALGIGTAPSPASDVEPPPSRPPVLCPACPHRSAFFAARTVFGEESLYFNDIGCYTLGVAPPLEAGDALLCMGAGFTLAAGVARTTGERTLGFLGDSTFFHSGMPALLNAVKERVDMVAVVLDNEVTAMTGFQQSPSTVVDRGRTRNAADIEAVVRALGVEQVETVDPNDLAATVAAFQRAKQREGLCVVIAKRPCPVARSRGNGPCVEPTCGTGPGPGAPAAAVSTFAIDHELCQSCGRAGCGKRCSQDVFEGFERAMVRARSLEVGAEVDRPAVAPCAVQCPLFLCVQGYAAHIAAGRYADALELIMSDLPLPESVCRVCHRPCETACVRAVVDEPVAINDLKRFVMDWANAQPDFPYAPQCAPDNDLRVAIVGAGPSGLAAAHELRLRGYAVDLFDADDEPGGLLRSGIPAYRLPREVLRRDVERILALGVEFHGRRRLGADLRMEELLERNAAVLLAVGAARGLGLEVPGVGPRRIDARSYLRADPPPARHVLVVGGGNSALDAARCALRNGAERVVISCLESRGEMPAIASEIGQAEREGAEILTRTRLLRLAPGKVELARVEPRAAGELSPANFETLPGEPLSLGADLVITAIGQSPDVEALGAPVLECAGARQFVDPETGASSHPRIFAAGDLVGGGGTVTGAIAAGLRAAWGLDRSLRATERADERTPPPRVPEGPAPQRSGVTRADRTARRLPPELEREARLRSFDEVVGSLSESDARAEAERCMICGLCGNCRSCLDLFGCPAFLLEGGRIEIDPQLCVACGVCAQFCPDDAIYPVSADRSTR